MEEKRQEIFDTLTKNENNAKLLLQHFPNLMCRPSKPNVEINYRKYGTIEAIGVETSIVHGQEIPLTIIEYVPPMGTLKYIPHSTLYYTGNAQKDDEYSMQYLLVKRGWVYDSDNGGYSCSNTALENDRGQVIRMNVRLEIIPEINEDYVQKFIELGGSRIGKHRLSRSGYVCQGTDELTAIPIGARIIVLGKYTGLDQDRVAVLKCAKEHKLNIMFLEDLDEVVMSSVNADLIEEISSSDNSDSIPDEDDKKDEGWGEYLMDMITHLLRKLKF